MTTTITPVNSGNNIEYGVLIDLTLGNTTYYISNCYKNVEWPVGSGTIYQALAGFLTISEIQSNISNANDEVQIGLSAIPPAYIAATLSSQIKGGEVNIYRVFFDPKTQQVITDQVYRRFTGIISNYSVQEDLESVGDSSDISHTITIIASSIMGVLESRVSGRRTNRKDYQQYYPELTYNTITSISSNVLTSANHGLAVDQPIIYHDSTQLGLTSGTTYYVIAPVATNTFKLSASLGGASLSLTNGSGLSLDWDYIDGSMNRIETLFNSSFDFGKPYRSKAPSSIDGGNGGGGGDGGGPGGGPGDGGGDGDGGDGGD